MFYLTNFIRYFRTFPFVIKQAAAIKSFRELLSCSFEKRINFIDPIAKQFIKILPSNNDRRDEFARL